MKSGKLLQLVLLLTMILFPVFMLASSFVVFFLKGLALTISLLTVLWVLSLLVKDSSIIDIFWGLGFVIMAWFYAWLVGWGDLALRNRILLILVSVWGIRLTAFLAYRNLGKEEDYRYVLMRGDGGKNWWWLSYFRVFILQGILLWIISSIFLLSLQSNTRLGILDYIGMSLWGIGFFFEAIGDWQMMQFKSDPANKGQVMDQGLWRYTRHPNYFGDATIWWGYFFFALSHPQGIFYIFSPILMNFLLLKISGVAMLERGLKKTKPKYGEYMRKTSAFIPRLPKK